MKYLLCLVASLAIAGCGSQPKYKITKEEAIKPRITRADILAGGGICNENDICEDIKAHQDYDCSAEASCFPINKKR